MVVETDAFHEAMHALTPDSFQASGTLAPDHAGWQMGDELPHADVPATIQH